MAKFSSTSNTQSRWAPLSNINLASGMLERALNRSQNLPGMVSFYGPSGLGKSMAAAYCANKFNGVYVECRSFFTKKSLMLAVLKEMGIRPAKMMHEMLDQIAEELMLSQRPLIIDEMDHIVDKSAVEVVRDILEASQGTIMLIGEEQFPRKLARWERFHNRMLIWQPAQPANAGDTKHLARFYCPGLDITDDLLARVLEISRGATRRVCVNLDLIRAYSETNGLKTIDLAAWGKRELYTGEAPLRGRAA